MQLILIAALVLAAPALAATGFDGRWSVSIVTEKGDCDRGYRYDFRIENGRLLYDGDGSFELSGAVATSGAVNVSISKGGQSASGSGRLSARSGSGTWRGRSSSGECVGRWEAERR
ncbi:MAG: hypothetical protein AB7O50_13040 [Pseudolabrys sp.]